MISTLVAAAVKGAPGEYYAHPEWPRKEVILTARDHQDRVLYATDLVVPMGGTHGYRTTPSLF